MENYKSLADALARVPGKPADNGHRKAILGDTTIVVPEACYDWLADHIISNIEIDASPITRAARDDRDAGNLPAKVSREYKGAGDDPCAGASAKRTLNIINVAELLQRPVRPVEFLVENIIPRDMVTGFLADGGMGKSTIALQLAAAGALNMPWLGLPVTGPFSTLYLSAEDSADICHERLRRIVKHMTGGDEEAFARLASVWFIDATHGSGIDPLLASWRRSSKLETTQLYSRIKAFIAEQGIDLVIIDSLADVFDEEIDRTAVRSFVRALHALGCGVLPLGHPSVSGMKDGRGYSGSTHWNNAFRARLYMYKPSDSKHKVNDDDARVIDVAKSNYGPSGQQLRVRFDPQQLVFVPEGESGGDPGAERERREKAAQQRFMHLLRLFDRTGETVSPKPSRTYAPTVFARHPENQKNGKFSKRELEYAMQQLLASEVLKIVEEGPQSKRRQRLHIVTHREECEDANVAEKPSKPSPDTPDC